MARPERMACRHRLLPARQANTCGKAEEKQMTDQPTNQPTSQPPNQPTNQPTNPPALVRAGLRWAGVGCGGFGWGWAGLSLTRRAQDALGPDARTGHAGHAQTRSAGRARISTNRQPTDQTTNQPTKQQANQPANQPTNQRRQYSSFFHHGRWVKSSSVLKAISMLASLVHSVVFYVCPALS